MELLFILIMCHLVGDYVLQCDFIAKTKGSNWYHLFVHCMLYALPFYIMFGFNLNLLIVLVVHFIVDAGKARYNKITYIMDQVLHYAVLILYLI